MVHLQLRDGGHGKSGANDGQRARTSGDGDDGERVLQRQRPERSVDQYAPGVGEPVERDPPAVDRRQGGSVTHGRPHEITTGNGGGGGRFNGSGGGSALAAMTHPSARPLTGRFRTRKFSGVFQFQDGAYWFFHATSPPFHQP